MASYLVICSDLFFTSKVTGTAQQLGYNCKTVMSGPKAISTLAEMDDLGGVVIDLKTPALDLEKLMEQIPDEIKPHTMAFGPHVDTEELALAQSLGVGGVFTRGQFTSNLPALLQQHLG